MDKPDWSIAPEGAEYWHPIYRAWYKYAAGSVYIWSNTGITDIGLYGWTRSLVVGIQKDWIKRPDNEWIKWDGKGGCPVDGDTVLKLKFRKGDIQGTWKASQCSWVHFNLPYDLVEYQIVEETQSLNVTIGKELKDAEFERKRRALGLGPGGSGIPSPDDEPDDSWMNKHIMGEGIKSLPTITTTDLTKEEYQGAMIYNIQQALNDRDADKVLKYAQLWVEK